MSEKLGQNLLKDNVGDICSCDGCIETSADLTLQSLDLRLVLELLSWKFVNFPLQLGVLSLFDFEFLLVVLPDVNWWRVQILNLVNLNWLILEILLKLLDNFLLSCESTL